MANDATNEQDKQAADVQTEAAETDWKAQARKWEKRAKENASAADELQKLKEAQMSELERAQSRASKAEEELKVMKAKAEHDALKASIASELNVPASLIAGSDEASMREWAKSLAEYAKPQVGASVPRNSSFASADGKDDDKLKLARQVFK